MSTLFFRRKTSGELGEARRADVFAKGASPTAGLGGLLDPDDGRPFKFLVLIAALVGAHQTVGAIARDLDHRLFGLLLEFRQIRGWRLVRVSGLERFRICRSAFEEIRGDTKISALGMASRAQEYNQGEKEKRSLHFRSFINVFHSAGVTG